MDAHRAGALPFHARAKRLQRLGNAQIVELLPRGGIHLEELRADDGPGEIVGHQLADLARLDDVLADAGETFGGGLEIGRNDVAAGEAILDDFGVANVRREQGLDLGPVNPGQKEDVIRRVLEQLEEPGGEHVAFLRHEGDKHAIGAAEFALILRERADVGMLERQTLVEARVDVEMRGVPPHDHREQAEHDHQKSTVAEDPVGEPFDSDFHSLWVRHPEEYFGLVWKWHGSPDPWQVGTRAGRPVPRNCRWMK